MLCRDETCMTLDESSGELTERGNTPCETERSNDLFDLLLGGPRDLGDGLERKKQCQLRAAQYHTVDVFGIAKTANDRHYALANVVAENALDHLIRVVVMDEDTFRLIWNHDVDIVSPQNVGVH